MLSGYWQSSSIMRNNYGLKALLPHQSDFGKIHGPMDFEWMWLAVMPSCSAGWPFHWGCQQYSKHLYECGAGCSTPRFAGGTEVGEPQQFSKGDGRVYLIWWLKSVWMTANLLVGWSLELSNYGSYHCPVARCWGLVCIQLRAVDWCCVHISHGFGSCSNLTAIMVSDRTCHSKASS